MCLQCGDRGGPWLLQWAGSRPQGWMATQVGSGEYFLGTKGAADDTQHLFWLPGFPVLRREDCTKALSAACNAEAFAIP